jgi:protein-L-isoaspartate(D-aspartate) O-methyltransferase
MEMVERQLSAHGISDDRVLSAMREVPRHEFVPERVRALAYEDRALLLGHGQTISQPYMVALMLELLELGGEERVLEVGAGSGYQAALLARLASSVDTVELVGALALLARENLARTGVHDVRVHQADGSLGLPERAPFDAVIVAAGAPEIPNAYLSQLSEGGRLVIPVGPRMGQTLTRVVRKGDAYQTERLFGCAFVPLLGKHGWEERRFF